MRRALALLLLLGLSAAPAHADEAVIAVIQERAAAHGVAAGPLVALSWCESRHNPFAVGDRGASVGAFQIHERGLLAHFRAQGYSDRANLFESADYVARVFAGHFAGITMSHWSCWGRAR